MRGEKIVSLARNLVGVSKWRLGSKPEEAPGFFDCSGLVQWLYRQVGVELPRLSWYQFAFFEECELNNAVAGDLLFVSSPYVNGIKTDAHSRLHVCVLTGENTVICATNSELGLGVIEISLSKLLETREFMGARRLP